MSPESVRVIQSVGGTDIRQHIALPAKRCDPDCLVSV